MAFNVSSITKYTNETAQALVKKAVATGKTIDLVSLIPGVKYKETLNILDNTISVQSATCGFSSNGAVAFKQRVIEVTPLEVKESLCEKTLGQYFLGQSMKAGSPKDEELGMILAESYVDKIKEFNELNIWKGKTTSPVYGKIDGFITKMIADSATIDPGSIAGPFTSSTIIAAVDKMVASIPEAILDKPDLTLFMSMAYYNMYTAALRTANLYQGNAGNTQEAGNYVCFVPGVPVKVVGTAGLTGTNYLVLTYASNLVVGTDLMNENEKFDIWYSQDNDEVRVNIQWKLGVQFYFPEFIVINA